MSPEQCRAARALLGWSQEQLAEKASVSVTTLRNYERGATVPVINNLRALQAALDAGGVEFIDANGGGFGVRLKAPPEAKVNGERNSPKQGQGRPGRRGGSR